MGKKLMGWKTKGMNQDLSVSAFNPEFSFENMNLRLSTNEGNTLMSWVNEKGTKRIPVKIDTNPWYETENKTYAESITGGAIGTAVLNNQLVVFTTCPRHIVMGGNQSTTIPKHDYIYVFTWRRFPVVSEQEDDEIVEGLFGRRIYAGNLNFNEEHPLETLVSYEAEHIQKVYWTDGINQPRMINIVASNEKLERWNHPNTEHEGVPSEDVETFFDFVPTIDLNATLSITQEMASSGTFAPGVIQYCFTYFNKHGQQSNVIEVSPLYYLAHEDRGASPEDKVTCSFNIRISGLDSNFDCVRIYSIQRTSLNLEPIVKILEDIPIEGNSITYIDNGTTGALIDPTELLFIGGKEIKVLTMTDKDNTLFMGNIEQTTEKLNDLQDYFRGNSPTINFLQGGSKTIELDHTDGIYGHTNMLKKNHREITTFKGGEQYRFGFQLQKPTGEWTEPIWIGDETNDLYPVVNNNNWDVVQLVYANASIDLEAAMNSVHLDYSNYKRIRPVIVYPTISDRKVLCQGVLNPTVFNALDRIDNSPYAQASWYFRPYVYESNGSDAVAAANPISVEAITEGEEGERPLVRISSHSLNEECTIPAAWGPVKEKLESMKLLQDVYVLVADITDTVYANNIPQRGFLQTVETSSNRPSQYVKHEFWGAIQLVAKDSTHSARFAFLKTTPWVEEQQDFGPERLTVRYTEGVRVVCNDNIVSPIYKDLKTSFNYLYYQKGITVGISDTAETYLVNIYFEIRTDTEYYDVQFVLKTGAGTTDDSNAYDKITNNTSGTPLESRHYSSLPVDEDYNNPEDKENARQVEIQGSRKSFDSAFVETLPQDTTLTDEQASSNTQFFVDQSIVTLNSPDLEFDTEVQRWGTGHLHLRVIGAIPITASISSHAIQISSSMLEMNHNGSSAMGKSIFELAKEVGMSNVAEEYKKAKVIASQDISFGSGELNYNILHKNIDINAGRRLVADYLWQDVAVTKDTDEEDKIKSSGELYKYLIYPWHRSGSLNNDWRSADVASSLLKWKKEGNLLYSINTKYLSNDHFVDYENYVNAQIVLTENSEVMNYRLGRQSDGTSEINYYPNIDKVLYNKKGYVPISDKDLKDPTKVYSPVSMKYKSTTHAVVALKQMDASGVSLLPYPTLHGTRFSSNMSNTFWGDTIEFKPQTEIDLGEDGHYSILWLGELYKDVTNAFGGNGDAALRANKWVVGGPSVAITEQNKANIPLTWTDGDTYYQRYDCLKTYAYTNEDPNQLVEILSFMCESHVNIDGRYDRNRGQLKNYLMRPEIFNLLNPVYSQQDNFFTSRKTDIEKEETLKYPNYVAYSQNKTSGADVDEWTHLTLASVLEMDGDKGEVTALKRLNDAVICFQDTGIAQILYNDNVAISTTAGIPIELANSGKVQGKRYLSDTIGCSNKWSIAQSPLGIYFIDSNGKDIYLFNGQLDNLSTKYGFNSWCKEHISQGVSDWNPKDFGWNSDIDKSNFVSYYDKKNQEVLFINLDTALAFSEKIGAFTSFYNYGGIPYYCNFNDRGIWLTYNPTTPTSSTNPVPECELWEHQAGEYCQFFGVNYPYWMTLVGNQEPQMDKTFTNLEFRATIDREGVEEEIYAGILNGQPIVDGQGNPVMVKTGRFIPTLPFDYLEAWDEYQHGIAQLQNKNGHGAMQHHLSDITAALKRKFRIWRCDIPRDNCDVDNTIENPMGIYRFRKRPLDRMRNPWIYLKLMKDAAEQGTALNRAEIHDLIMTYYT